MFFFFSTHKMFLDMNDGFFNQEIIGLLLLRQFEMLYIICEKLKAVIQNVKCYKYLKFCLLNSKCKITCTSYMHRHYTVYFDKHGKMTTRCSWQNANCLMLYTLCKMLYTIIYYLLEMLNVICEVLNANLMCKALIASYRL